MPYIKKHKRKVRLQKEDAELCFECADFDVPARPTGGDIQWAIVSAGLHFRAESRGRGINVMVRNT